MLPVTGMAKSWITFEHGISQCVVLEYARRGLDPDAFNALKGLKLCKINKASKKLIGISSTFVMKNKLNFPVRLEVFAFTGGSNLGS